MRKVIDIDTAKDAYRKGYTVYKNGRRLPASYEYGSGAPAAQLFYRSCGYMTGDEIFSMEV